jgi:hypothetical protein
MAVTFDAKGTADATSNGATGQNFTNLTITGGLSNSALVAQFAFSLKTIASLAVKWDNAGTPQSMTSIVAANGTGTVARAELWGLIAPTSGNKTLNAAWTGASDICVQAVSWSGVDQAGGTTSFAHSTSATGTANASPGTHNSLAITSAVNNATMDAVCGDAATYNSVNQTSTYIDNAPATISGAASRAAGAATVTHTWQASGTSNHWVSVGVDIVAAAAAAATTSLLLLLGNLQGGGEMGALSGNFR